jgi:Protein of unknown function (DUF3515)
MRPPRVRSSAMGVALAICLTLSVCSCDGDNEEPDRTPGPVNVQVPSPTGEERTRCRSMLERLPAELIGLASREVIPTQTPAAAWGDPAVVLRCGVSEPPAFTPTSMCFSVDDVNWFPTIGGVERQPTAPTDQTQVFTTIGRSPPVELTVPGDYASDAPGALASIAKAVESSTMIVDPDLCLSGDID